jgi:hypothetical protein
LRASRSAWPSAREYAANPRGSKSAPERDLERVLLLRPALRSRELLVVLRERLLVDRGAELRLDLLACLRLRLVVAAVELVRAALVVTPRQAPEKLADVQRHVYATSLFAREQIARGP